MAITGEGDVEVKWGEVYDNIIESRDRFTEVKEGGGQEPVGRCASFRGLGKEGG